MQKLSLLCCWLYPERVPSEGNQCSRRRNAAASRMGQDLHTYLWLSDTCDHCRIHKISVFISIENKCREKSQESLFEVKNVKSYQQQRLLKWTRRLGTSWKPSASWHQSRGPSWGSVWRSRLTKSHRKGERAARYWHRCSAVVGKLLRLLRHSFQRLARRKYSNF